jgi:phosphoserine phosphatase RsbU/P
VKARIGISSILFYSLSVLIAVVCIISFVSAVTWLNKPFAGFLVYKDTFVSASGQRDWPGPHAGIKFRERILAVDGQAIAQGPDLVNILRKKPVGSEATYLVESQGKTRKVVVPVSRFDISDFLNVFLVPFLVGFVLFVLGFIVYFLKPNTATSWTFLILCFTLGTMILAGLENQTSYYLVRFFYTINTLYAFNFLHLFLIFPERKRILDKFPALEYLIYLPAVILIIAFQIYFTIFQDIFGGGVWSWFPTYKELGSINRICTLVCVVGMIALIFHTRFKASTIQAKQRARVIFWGVVISFGPPVVIMSLVFFVKINFPWNLLSFFVVFFPASIAYSIVKHNLFDADTIIKRTVGYIVVTTVVVGAYICVSLMLNMFLGRYELAQSKVFPILFTLGVILVFNPLRDRIQSIVDRLFYRLEYNYQAVVQKISETMRSLLKLDEIGKSIMDTALGAMFIDSGCVMLMNRQTQGYECISASGECFLPETNSGVVDMPGTPENVLQDESKHSGLHINTMEISISCEDPLIQKIAERRRGITIYDVLEDAFFEDDRVSCEKTFERLNATLIIPLIYKDRVTGLISLGDKKSGKFYRREDINLLNTLANQGAVALENAFMLQEVIEKERMEEELSIAKDLQVSMLPAECPEIAGLDIAAYSMSAMEVGGDFYDFIEMGADKACLVIGDVTGKSVSGALVMSASRSIFRMLSEENVSVADIMIRANRRTKKDIKSGMFVALLYAVLDAKEKRIQMCSAGQTQPIHLRAGADRADLVETVGDTFPLGILEDVDYQETQVQMTPGDKLVFYTDGIVEAMNPASEMFGFERLQEIIRQSKALNADALLKEIVEGVEDFAAGAAQHDDITIIVVNVEG